MKKIVSLFLISAISVGALCIPAMAEELQYEKLQDEGIILNQIKEVESTTGSAIEIKDLVKHEDLENKDFKIVRLEAEIKGSVFIGNEITAKVKGYNSKNEEIELNEGSIRYKWIENDEFTGEQIIGNKKKLEITEDMIDKDIYCKVDYRN
ncbi:hypothetical protein FDB61_17810 [Clostridium botulinum]|nr:hypothetical protein [Clostridium botulinum]